MDQQFYRLAVPSINTNIFKFPFVFNTQLLINLQLPDEAFESLYYAFDNKIGVMLTVLDLQCVFECQITTVQLQKKEDGFTHSQMTFSSFNKMLFDNTITVDTVNNWNNQDAQNGTSSSSIEESTESETEAS